jgi:urease accessory protein
MTASLALLQIADSALPIGGYTHSWGLEAAIARGLVNGPESLERWTAGWLRASIGPLEGVLVASSCRLAAAGQVSQVIGLNHLAEVSIVVPNIRRACRELGNQLITLAGPWPWCRDALADYTRDGPDDWYHPVVFGLLGALAHCPPQEVLTAYLHQAALGMISAGLRAVPVGHTHGQQVHAYLHQDIRDLAAEMSGRDPETAGAGCPFYEVLCDEQTRLYARMFRS